MFPIPSRQSPIPKQMKRPILYVAITNHGFGHATRTAAVAANIQKLCPQVLLIMVTTAPRWLLESYIEGDFIHRPRAYDLGVVQTDSLQMDKAATLSKLRAIKQDQNSIIASEVNFIRQNRVQLILADIPFLAAEIARAAGIPCWMHSNFGWDFIYREWGGEFVEIADWIASCYESCDRLFRFPFHEPMSAFSNITDVGLPGGSPRFEIDELRSEWGITANVDKTVLMSFGGLGLQQIPYHNIKRYPDWQFITFDRYAPDLPNLIPISDKRLRGVPRSERKYRPVDFMPLCSCVISKPGFSTFAEATKLGTPIISLTRENFAEGKLLQAGIANYNYHQFITPQTFFQGNWDFLSQPLKAPKSPKSIAIDGNETIARAVVNYIN